MSRLRTIAQSKARNLKVRAVVSERILVELDGDAYLFMFPGSWALLTPGRIMERVKHWPRFRQRTIKGHIVLSSHADLSHRVITGDGANIPPRVAVIGKWGSQNHFAASEIDANMSYLLEVAGISRSEVRRSFKKHTQRGQRAVPASASPTSEEDNRQIRSLRKGTYLDSYELDERLGRGHSAEVWKAKVRQRIPGVNLVLNAAVAIKIYNQSLLQGFQPLRIQREFLVASELQHRNLARVYDLLLSPSRPFHTFMVMEYVEGPTLKSFIEKHGRLTFGQTLTIAGQLFSALAEMHSSGAVHRDVKAANIMVASESPLLVKLVDLGIVSVASEDQFTQASQFLGSKHSAPLEQLTGEQLDERTDLYGAGSVLYHCIRGVPMYHGAGPEGAIVRQMLRSPERLDIESTQLAGAERQFLEFINRCISVDRKDRPINANACVGFVNKLVPVK